MGLENGSGSNTIIKYYTYSKNYFIPIHPANLEIPKQYHSKLKAIDKILVYSDFELDKFLNIGINKDKIIKLPLPSIKVPDTKLDIGIYKNGQEIAFKKTLVLCPLSTPNSKILGDDLFIIPLCIYKS